MSFWDRPVKDTFEEMFDLDRNGRLDAFEEALEFEFLEESTRVEEDEDDSEDPDLDSDDLESLLEDEDLTDDDIESILEAEDLDLDDF